MEKIRLFHDQTEGFVTPCVPDPSGSLIIGARVEAPKGTEVFLAWSNCAYDLMNEDYTLVRMAEKGDGLYTASLICPPQTMKYHFVVRAGEEDIIFGCDGRRSQASKEGDYAIVPGYDTPEWSKGALWYQIMPDSFFNGDPLNDKLTSGDVRELAWSVPHAGGDDYYGGDLKGIMRKLSYIQSLGAEVVSLNPIWKGTHQAGYGADDLTAIDSCFGNAEHLVALSSLLHSKGMRLCLDGVFDYLVLKSKYFNAQGFYPLAGGEKDGDPYYGIFLRDKGGKYIESYWSHPICDFSKKAWRDFSYLAEDSVTKTYLKPPYAIDAWRMDVGNVYEGSDPVHFGNAVDVLADMRKAVKSVGEDKLLITENDLPRMRNEGSVDSKWNYELGLPLRDWAAGKISQSEFIARARRATYAMPRPMAESAFNHITTHDTARIADTAEGNMPRILAATLFMMTFVGAPSIYFGDENGAFSEALPGMGKAAPVSFNSMNWSEAERNNAVFHLYRTLGGLRKHP
ncbi:MAG: hypothetical protein IJF71_01870, partial [Clostridia bacterium]|nr:hypothetical protein [Clostridia bacterium]